MTKSLLSFTACGLALSIAYQSAQAYDINDTVELHGYGNLGYLQTSDNQYLSANSSGSSDYYSGALLLTATISEKSKFWAQGFASSNGPRRNHMDWMFIDYRVNSNVTLRAGQIKFPMGIYNEIRDIEYIQLSTLRPALYREEANIADEALQGASLLIEHDIGNGQMTWDIVAGETVEYQEPEYKYSNLFGGRLIYSTPIEGLRLMYSGHIEDVQQIDTGDKGQEITSIYSFDYVNNSIDAKAEFAHKTSLTARIVSGYVQFGYHIDDRWTPYLRSDYLNTDISRNDDPSYFQKTNTLGLGYKFNQYFGLRAEMHYNYGYALPVAKGDMAPGSGLPDWRMMALSLNMMF